MMDGNVDEDVSFVPNSSITSFREESQEKMSEMVARTDERFSEVANRQGKEETRREEVFAELKE